MPDATTTLAIADAAGAKFGPLGYLLVLLVVGLGTAILWLIARNPQRLANADTDGQIDAIAFYKDLLKTEREARMATEARADKFAQERNDALKTVGELTGELRAIKEE